MSPIPLERHGQLVREVRRELQHLVSSQGAEDLRALAEDLAEDVVRLAHSIALTPERAEERSLELQAQARALAEAGRVALDATGWAVFDLAVSALTRGVAAALRVVLFGVGG